MGLDTTLDEIISVKLAELRDQLNAYDSRFETLEKSGQDLSAKIEEKGQEVQQLRDELDQKTQDLTKLTDKVAVLEELDPAQEKERIARFEEDGKEFREKVDSMEPKLTEMQRIVDEFVAKSGATKTHADELGDAVRKCVRQMDETKESVRVSEERVQKMDEKIGVVEESHEVLSASVSKKYESLWEDILREIREVNNKQLQALKNEVERKNEEARLEAKGILTYATQLMVSVRSERRQLSDKRDLVAAWREQSWTSARRRMGLYTLHHLARRKQREVLARWVRRTMIEQLEWRLRKQYGAMIPDVDQHILNSGLEGRCDCLDQTVLALQHDKCESSTVNQRLEAQAEEFSQKLLAIGELRRILDEHHVVIQKNAAENSRQDGLSEKLEKSIAEGVENAANLVESLADCAKAKEVQNMMRDILLIWNSIKQLDAAKADKKDVDAFAMESSNRDKLAERRLKEVEDEKGSKTREETVKNQEKWMEFEGRLDDSAKQLRHWEQMWEKLASFVEDLVTKIAEIQGFDGGRPPTGGTATLRRGNENGRPPSLAHNRSRPDIPQMPMGSSDRESAFEGAMPRAQSMSVPGAMDSMESKMLWINNAKGFVDAAGEAAAAQTPSRMGMRPARPKSASGRRPVDRGR